MAWPMLSRAAFKARWSMMPLPPLVAAITPCCPGWAAAGLSPSAGACGVRRVISCEPFLMSAVSLRTACSRPRSNTRSPIRKTRSSAVLIRRTRIKLSRVDPATVPSSVRSVCTTAGAAVFAAGGAIGCSTPRVAGPNRPLSRIAPAAAISLAVCGCRELVVGLLAPGLVPSLPSL